ncbi:hypothetical protein HV436_18480, partial [Bacillus sporothermodurans]|nr:hypothetical protein [Heyndrickxia sporothermodurans]
YMRCLNGGLLVNYHYTRFGEVLLFLSLKPLDTQGLRIMKFIHIINLLKNSSNNSRACEHVDNLKIERKHSLSTCGQTVHIQ